MIAAWMAYGIAISLLLCCVGLAVERACRLRRWPSRWIWAVALAAPFALPLAATRVDESPVHTRSAATADAVPPALADVEERPTPVAKLEHRAYRMATSHGVASLLGILWLCGSMLLAAGLARSWFRIRRKSDSWSRRALDGVNVLVSDEIGPAVIGFWHPRIVVPQWLLRADEHVRRLTLAHEGQHVRARDPLLLLAATVAVVLLPWNLPLWWQ